MQNQTEATRNMYGDMLGTSQRIAPDFEWNGFVKRNGGLLIDRNAPKRTVESIGFANQDHRSTKPLIAGSLERKGKLMGKYSTAFYVVTPSKYLHEFKTDDDFSKEPSPENSLYLPDCLIGAVDGVKFNVKGKDLSKGALSKMSMSHEFAFKAHTPQDAQKWHETIAAVAGQTTNERPETSAPTSPVAGSTASDEKYQSMAPSTIGSEGTAAPAYSSGAGEYGSAAPGAGASDIRSAAEKEAAGANHGVGTYDRA